MQRQSDGILPRYKCHKEVWALKIKELTVIASGGGVITPAEPGYPVFSVDAAYMSKHAPTIGGYWVRYDDNYESFSPADVFEGGYTRI